MNDSPSKYQDGSAIGVRGAQTATSGVRQLVHEHYEQLYRYAYRLTGNVADAEDLTQQTFLAAQEKLHQLRELAAARGWLFQILRRLFLKSRRKRIPRTGDSWMDVETVAVETDFDRNFNAEFLQQKLNELPDHFRLVLLMFYFEGKNYESIAESLDIPLGTVMSRLARAKAHLRRRLRSTETMK